MLPGKPAALNLVYLRATGGEGKRTRGKNRVGAALPGGETVVFPSLPTRFPLYGQRPARWAPGSDALTSFASAGRVPNPWEPHWALLLDGHALFCSFAEAKPTYNKPRTLKAYDRMASRCVREATVIIPTTVPSAQQPPCSFLLLSHSVPAVDGPRRVLGSACRLSWASGPPVAIGACVRAGASHPPLARLPL